MRSLTPERLNTLSFSVGDVANLAALAEARGRQQLYVQQKPEVLDALRQVAAIL